VFVIDLGTDKVLDTGFDGFEHRDMGIYTY
jgi:hypothetical protein